MRDYGCRRRGGGGGGGANGRCEITGVVEEDKWKV